MKNLILIALLSIAFISCEEKENEATSSTVDSTETVSKEALLAFNTPIVDAIDLSELLYQKMSDLDYADVSPEEITDEAEKAKLELEARISELQGLTPLGKGAEEYLNAAIAELMSVKDVMQVYVDFSDILSIPDDDWTTEFSTEWFNMAEPIFQNYIDSYKALDMAQGNFASLNDLDIVPKEETLEEMYEEL